jgi:ribosomal protein S6
MQKYFLVLIYKPTLTKEQVEEEIIKDIHPIFNEYGIDKPKYTYCGNKLFAYIIKKHKSGHYVALTFHCDNLKQKNNITPMEKRINEIQDIIRVVAFKSSNPDEAIDSLTKININIDSKELYL